MSAYFCVMWIVHSCYGELLASHSPCTQGLLSKCVILFNVRSSRITPATLTRVIGSMCAYVGIRIVRITMVSAAMMVTFSVLGLQ